MEAIRDRYTLYFGDLDTEDSLELSKKFFSEFKSNPPTIEDALADLGVQPGKLDPKRHPGLASSKETTKTLKS